MNAKTFFAAAAFAAAALSAVSAHAALPDEYALNLNYPTPVAAGKAAAPRIVERVAQVDEYQRNQYPAGSPVALLQRVQVTAEAIEARKLGLIAEGEATPVATAAQIEQVRQAGIAAVQHHVAAQ